MYAQLAKLDTDDDYQIGVMLLELAKLNTDDDSVQSR